MQDHWPVRLFRKSVLKQNKFNEITTFLGQTDHLHCLDIGSDNGVISYLFRQRGGTWKSADLEDRAVQSIRELVQDDVYQINGRKTSFQDNEFDRVVIVDFLEHIQTDQEFIGELYRIIKPGGELIINVPHIKNTLLRKFRAAIGQTDKNHGHVRPGYTIDGLKALLMGRFTILSYKTYSRFFSECIDTSIAFAFDQLRNGQPASTKGLLVTGQDLNRHQKLFRFYSFIYPVVWFFSKLDILFFWCSGYMLLAKTKINKKNTSIEDLETVTSLIGETN